MLRLIDPKLPIRWVHPADRNIEDQKKAGKAPADALPAIFHIVPLTVGQQRRLDAALQDKGGPIRQTMMDYYLDLFVTNVVKIENIRLASGELGTITAEADKQAFLDGLPVEYWPPIFKALQEYSALSEGEEKNSGDSSGMPTS